jgi:hypothetical protein
MSHSLECWQDCVPRGAGSHFAEQTAMDFSVIPMLSSFQGPSRPPDLWEWCEWTGKERMRYTWQPSHLLIWQQFFSYLQHTLNHGQLMLEEVHLILQCFLVFFKYWYSWKVLFLNKGPEIHTLQNVCYSTNNKCVCVCGYLFMCFSAYVCDCVCVFLGAVAHRVVWILFLLSLSVRNPFQKMALQLFTGSQ